MKPLNYYYLNSISPKAAYRKLLFFIWCVPFTYMIYTLLGA